MGFSPSHSLTYSLIFLFLLFFLLLLFFSYFYFFEECTKEGLCRCMMHVHTNTILMSPFIMRQCKHQMRSYIIFHIQFFFYYYFHFFFLTYSSVFITQKLLLNIFSMPLCLCFCAAFLFQKIMKEMSRRSYCKELFEAHSECVFG